MGLSKETVEIAQALIYRRWAEAHDDYKAVRQEKDDGSPDWGLFHVERLKNNGNTLNKYQRALDDIIKFIQEQGNASQ